MTQAKHTKGPWAFKSLGAVSGKNAGLIQLEQIVDNFGNEIARIDYSILSGSELGHKHGEANATLIAASPELLEALRNAANTFYALRDHAQSEGLAGTVEQNAINAIIAAIAKAQGGVA